LIVIYTVKRRAMSSKTLDIIGFVVIFKVEFTGRLGCWWRRFIRFSREDLFFGRE